MTNKELKEIIIAQRKYYGEALQKLADLLIKSDLNDFAEIAMRLRDNYGLEDAFALAIHKNILTKENAYQEISSVLKQYRDTWLSKNDIIRQVSGSITKDTWYDTIQILMSEGNITRRGHSATTVFRWIAD